MTELASRFETRRPGYPTLRVVFLSQDTSGSSIMPINAVVYGYPADLDVSPVEINGSRVPKRLLNLMEGGEVDMIYYEMPDLSANNLTQKEQIASVVGASEGRPVLLGTTNEDLDEEQLLRIQQETGVSGVIIKDWELIRFHQDFIDNMNRLLQVPA